MKKMMALVLVIVMMMTVCAMPAMAESADAAAYRTLYSSEISSLNYLTTATTSEFALAANVIDTLVEYN